jgi:chaperone modulatory protein CbpM
MTTTQHPLLVGQVVEEEELSLEQLCDLCAVGRTRILELVEEGVIEPTSPGDVRFAGASLRRARVALRLQRDFAINAPGVALVLDLLERVEVLERRVAGRT